VTDAARPPAARLCYAAFWSCQQLRNVLSEYFVEVLLVRRGCTGATYKSLMGSRTDGACSAALNQSRRRGRTHARQRRSRRRASSSSSSRSP